MVPGSSVWYMYYMHFIGYFSFYWNVLQDTQKNESICWVATNTKICIEKKTMRNNHTSILYVFDLVDLTTSVSSFSSSECSDSSKPPSCNTRIVTILIYLSSTYTIIIICLGHIPKRGHTYLWPPIQESVHGLKTCTSIINTGKMLYRFPSIIKINKLKERKPHNENSGKKLYVAQHSFNNSSFGNANVSGAGSPWKTLTWKRVCDYAIYLYDNKLAASQSYMNTCEWLKYASSWSCWYFD